MLWLTDLLRRPVLGPGGEEVGRLLDLVVEVGEEHPVVNRLAIGHHRVITHMVPWSDASMEADGTLTIAAAPRPVSHHNDGTLTLESGDLLLARDVLDTQIVDVAGHRVVRVGDVTLTQSDAGRLEVLAVEVGFGMLCRRLGLRRLGRRFAEQAVDWTDLHLTSDRGHLVQLATPTAAMHRLDATELAHLVARLPTGRAADVLGAVEPERAAAVLASSDPYVRHRVWRALSPKRASTVIRTLSTDRAERARAHLEEPRPSRRRYLRHRGWRRRLPVDPPTESAR